LLLPDARLDVKRVRGMDATVRYDADALRLSPSLSMKQVAIGLSLDNGLLHLDPVAVELPQGRLTAVLNLDARQDVPHGDIDATLKKAHLEDLVKMGGSEPAIEGPIQARLKLRGEGASIHQFAEHSDGRIAAAIPQGEIRQAFAELLGID